MTPSETPNPPPPDSIAVRAQGVGMWSGILHVQPTLTFSRQRAKPRSEIAPVAKRV